MYELWKLQKYVTQIGELVKLNKVYVLCLENNTLKSDYCFNARLVKIVTENISECVIASINTD